MTPIRLHGEGGTITIEPDTTDACIVECHFTSNEERVHLGGWRAGSSAMEIGFWLELAESIVPEVGDNQDNGIWKTLVLNFGPLRYSLYGTIQCPERVLVVNDGRGPVKNVGAIRLSYQQVEEWKRQLDAMASALKWSGDTPSPLDSVSVTPLRVEGEGGSLFVEPDVDDAHIAHCRFQGSGALVNLGQMGVAQIPMSMERWFRYGGSGVLPVAGTLGGNRVTLVMAFPPPGYSLYGTVGGPQWVLHIVDSRKSPQEEVGAIRLSKEQQWEWRSSFGRMCDHLEFS